MKYTNYIYRLALCVPEHLIHEANQMACCLFESAEDVNTFTTVTHEKDGIQYACVAPSVTKRTIDMFTYGLPYPEHAVNVDRDLSLLAYSKIGEEIFMKYGCVTIEADEYFTELGMTRLPQEELDE